MALVGEASLLRDPGKRLIGPADQSLGALEPTLGDITPRAHSNRLLERAAEVIRAEACYGGEIGQSQAII